MANEPKETDQAAEEAEGQAETGADASGEAGMRRRRFAASRKTLPMIALPALLIGAGGYLGIAHYDISGLDAPLAAETAKSRLYYDLPEMVVNLSSGDKRVQYLKLKVALEAADQKVLDALGPVMPRILDMFQLYLRELRASDLEGSAGVFRLKEELLRRINLEIHPRRVDRVLFKEIIVQ